MSENTDIRTELDGLAARIEPRRRALRRRGMFLVGLPLVVATVLFLASGTSAVMYRNEAEALRSELSEDSGRPASTPDAAPARTADSLRRVIDSLRALATPSRVDTAATDTAPATAPPDRPSGKEALALNRLVGEDIAFASGLADSMGRSIARIARTAELGALPANSTARLEALARRLKARPRLDSADVSLIAELARALRSFEKSAAVLATDGAESRDRLAQIRNLLRSAGANNARLAGMLAVPER